MTDFDSFELKLAETDFQKQFISTLPLYYHPKFNLRKTLTNILRKYLSKTLALQFVTQSNSNNKVKKVFKGTKMYMCMLATISKTHTEERTLDLLTEKTFLSELGNVFPNAKDWEGRVRVQKNKNNATPED
ncbi:uncharacterized protein LOC127286464 [Leptopilina boulardi]|uniref:uncharacterized protein LOC127286464 n=1 Tax=Leptopilina boulardi TaxID=63433 RepID=UPI0021F52250|nr:uncharacterized protein LOC127286464 [Leptopilina boulardi]